MPDSLKGQHTTYLTAGNVLYSDLGRVMASIVKDEAGWNDTFCSPSALNRLKNSLASVASRMP